MSRLNLVACLVLGLLAVSLSACGVPGTTEISGDATCAEYIKQPADIRHDAAVRLSSEFGARNAGNPMWAFSLDQACGSNPSMTIKEYFDRG